LYVVRFLLSATYLLTTIEHRQISFAIWFLNVDERICLTIREIIMSRLMAFFGALFFLAGLQCPAYASLVLQVSGATLTGATGVVVDGTSYDVSFVQGTCNTNFNNCATFTFDQQHADDANKALFFQVLPAADNVFPQIAAIAGCPAFNLNAPCQIITPYIAYAIGPSSTEFNAKDLAVYFLPSGANPSDYTALATFDTTGTGTVFAVWTQSASASVPEPATAFLLGVVGLGLMATRRHVVRT